MNILFYPIFTNVTELTDHYYRLHWYLYPFKNHISKITLLYLGEYESIGSVPEYLDPNLKELTCNLSSVDIIKLKKQEDSYCYIAQSEVVLLWRVDPNQPCKIPKFLYSDQIKNKSIFRIDHESERFAGSFYLKFAELFKNELDLAEEMSKKIFEHIAKRFKSNKGYIFGTGPNLSLVGDKDFSDGISIACNSMVRNRELLDRLNPPIIVVADPIFHAGPSSYAASFRNELVAALDKYQSYLIVPLRDYHIYKTYLPSRFHDRIAAIPFKKISKPNLNMEIDFYVASTANVLTLFLLPIASTLFDEICISGCDGRPLGNDNYFWEHDRASQFNEQMDLIKLSHPAFFQIDYNDYYSEHCNILDVWLDAIEDKQQRISNLTPSYIPALRKRYCNPLEDLEGVSEVIMLDPDAIDSFGHFLAFDDRMYEACNAKSLAFSVFGNIHCSREIINHRAYFEPVFSVHSWTIGNTNAPKEGDVSKFTSELRNALHLREQCGLCHNMRLYIYCGSLPVAKAISEVLDDFDNISAVVCLFWLSFVEYGSQSYINKWKCFLRQADVNSRLILTSPTQRLASNIERIYGVCLPVAPHSSTTFSDADVDNMLEDYSKQEVKEKQKYKILFPGGSRKEKGFDLTVKFVEEIVTAFSGNFDVIVRAYINHNTPSDMQEIADELNGLDCKVEAGDLTNNEFSDLLQSSDIIVLPYKAPDFSERTSGLLIDAIYLGKPVIVLQNTWLADVVTKYQNGIVLKGLHRSDFADALIMICDNFKFYVSQSCKARRSYLRENKWEKLIHSITNSEFLISDFGDAAGHCEPASGNVRFSRENKATLDETNIIAYLMSGLPKSSVMIDVGAHHGSALSPFNKKHWNIYAFEPDPKNRKYLIERFGTAKNVVISQNAVSDTSQKSVDFYSSEESTGISGMLQFRDTHQKAASVDTTTIADIVENHKLEHIDFLKIDVEGYDLAVLKGVPWKYLKPDVIECEFEDAKTKLLGHNWEDICNYLSSKGYAVYISEWHPIIRYGIRHDWCALKKYPCSLESVDAWGNLLAFKNDPGMPAIQQALQKVLKVDHPELKPGVDSVSEKPVKAAIEQKISQQKSTEHQAKTAISARKSSSPSIGERKSIVSKISSYAQFAEWLQSKNLTLFRIGQFMMWMIRFVKRHTVASIIGVTILLSLILTPLAVPIMAPLSFVLWGSAVLLLFSAVLLIGVSFGNKKMMDFSENQFYLRQSLKNQLQRDYQSKLKDLTARFENKEKQLEDLSNALDAAQKQGEVYSKARKDFASRLESHRSLQVGLARDVEVLQQRGETDITKIQQSLDTLHKQQADLASLVESLQHQGEVNIKTQQGLAGRLDIQREQQTSLASVVETLQQESEVHIKSQQDLSCCIEKQNEQQENLVAIVGSLQQQNEAYTEIQQDLAGRLENQGKQQADLASVVEALHQQSEAHIKAQQSLASVIESLHQQSEIQVKVQQERNAFFESQYKHQEQNKVELEQKINRLATSAPVFNFVDYQQFNRKVNKEHVDIFQHEWSRKLAIKVTPKTLAYQAHRICTLESNSRGRMATTIEDVLLRALVASAVKADNLRVLEIGTLFGIGAAGIYDLNKTRFNNIHITAIDPLDGYYGKDNLDIVTNETISEATFKENLCVAGVPQENITLLQMMSTDDQAIEAAAKRLHDVLIIDGDHSFAGVKADFVNYLSCVKRGGYIIFDDYDAPEWPDVKRFVDEAVKTNSSLAFVGASWRTAVFRVVSKAKNSALPATLSGSIVNK